MSLCTQVDQPWASAPCSAWRFSSAAGSEGRSWDGGMGDQRAAVPSCGLELQRRATLSGSAHELLLPAPPGLNHTRTSRGLA